MWLLMCGEEFYDFREVLHAGNIRKIFVATVPGPVSEEYGLQALARKVVGDPAIVVNEFLYADPGANVPFEVGGGEAQAVRVDSCEKPCEPILLEPNVNYRRSHTVAAGYQYRGPVLTDGLDACQCAGQGGSRKVFQF